MNTSSNEKIREYAYKLVSARAYSESSLKEKLQKKYPEKDKEIAEIIDRLKELDYINDKVFCKNFIEYRLREKPCGVFKLAQDLKKKGISEETSEDFLQEIDEYTYAADALKRKLPQVHEKDPRKKKIKLMRFLQSRGFGYDAIRESIENLK